MNFIFFIRSITYISLEFLFAYKLERSNLATRKYFYGMGLILVLFEIFIIKTYTSDFWDRQALGFISGYILYFSLKNLIKKG